MSDIKTDPKTYLRRAVILKKLILQVNHFFLSLPLTFTKKEIYIGRPIVTEMKKRNHKKKGFDVDHWAAWARLSSRRSRQPAAVSSPIHPLLRLSFSGAHHHHHHHHHHHDHHHDHHHHDHIITAIIIIIGSAIHSELRNVNFLHRANLSPKLYPKTSESRQNWTHKKIPNIPIQESWVLAFIKQTKSGPGVGGNTKVGKTDNQEWNEVVASVYKCNEVMEEVLCLECFPQPFSQLLRGLPCLVGTYR